MPSSLTGVLCWPKRLLSADDLRRHLTSQREMLLLPGTVITPLAADELRARGVHLRWQAADAKAATGVTEATWIYALEKADPVILAALQALNREGVAWTMLESAGPAVALVRNFAQALLAGKHRGGVLFCGEPLLASCVANKIAGVRAAAVYTVTQVAQARKSFGPNLFLIEMPGRTFFEIRQMLKTIAGSSAPCPEEIANTLKELDGHAHR